MLVKLNSVGVLRGGFSENLNLKRMKNRLTSIFNFLRKICTGGPRYMRQIGTVEYDLHITSSNIKRPRMTINQRMGSINKDHSQSLIHKFADKKTAYNGVEVYFFFQTKRAQVSTGFYFKNIFLIYTIIYKQQICQLQVTKYV